MSNQSPFGARGRVLPPSLPRGEVLATYETYVEAQAAVEALTKFDFPVKQLSIVGNDLKSVERVTGKLTYGRVALAGAASGAWLGIFFGLLFFIFSPTGSSLPFVAAALLIGAGFGMFFGLATYTVNRRRRDFTSTMQVIAGNYQVIVDVALVNRARNLLAGSGSGAADVAVPDGEPVAAPPAAGTERPAGNVEPPEYGERAPAPGEHPPAR
ncbi:general stress protein [Cryobacterium sp. MLB-32]|uniref:general stress protein n=1 Tax=Cryobacterium sp. MLB-32 TaxID=1529318 RepID=UPI000690545F|nr:general stress protein [Cryobacterium sp. MLB-32]